MRLFITINVGTFFYTLILVNVDAKKPIMKIQIFTNISTFLESIILLFTGTYLTLGQRRQKSGKDQNFKSNTDKTS